MSDSEHEADDDRPRGKMEPPEHLEAELRRRVLADPPRCLEGVDKSPAAAVVMGNELLTVAFDLRGNGGQRVARVMAYDLRRFNNDCDGPPAWISPVMLQWEGEAGPTVVFDSREHGYHGECGSPTHIRGTGTPDSLRCGTCGGERFRVAADFAYWGATLDLLEDAYYDGEPEQDVQNYFSAVRFRCTCEACGATAELMQDDM